VGLYYSGGGLSAEVAASTNDSKFLRKKKEDVTHQNRLSTKPAQTTYRKASKKLTQHRYIPAVRVTGMGGARFTCRYCFIELAMLPHYKTYSDSLALTYYLEFRGAIHGEADREDREEKASDYQRASYPEFRRLLRYNALWRLARRLLRDNLGRLLRFDLGLLDGWIKQHTVMPMPSRHLR
jgi:hypothetical protein